jgi:hypothetical protein
MMGRVSLEIFEYKFRVKIIGITRRRKTYAHVVV